MYIICRQPEPLSTSVMRFQSLWIYDLRQYHDFWKEQLKQRASSTEWAFDSCLWRALLKIYGLHLFSASSELSKFASDYHLHCRHSISSKNIRETFAKLKRLGLEKIGHLQRLPRSQIQSRFGKAWADFFQGISEPEKALWVWQPHHRLEPIEVKINFDEALADAQLIVQQISQNFSKLSQQNSKLRVKKIELSLHLSDPEVFEFSFPHPLLLKNEEAWIKHLLFEKFSQLCLDAAVFCVNIKIYQAENFSHSQLNLFEYKFSEEPSNSHFHRERIYERLQNQGFEVFQPSMTSSYLPELSWKKNFPYQDIRTEGAGLFRPLIQQDPNKIEKPEGRLKFSERLQWSDNEGEHRRDYFILRGKKNWIWIFQNERQEWYEQGVLE